jgi:Tol biopolymer transport system component
MGECYEKLGSEEAARAYLRVLQDYADQTEIVSRARQRLAGLNRPEEEAENSSIVVRHLWAGGLGEGPHGGPDGSGGPSPDGRYLAYVDWRTGDVAVRDLATGEARRLTYDGGFRPDDRQYSIGAEFSPDGNSIAYTWLLETVGTQELRVVSLDGSPPRTLYRDPDWWGPLAWSNDGRYIATGQERDEGVHEVFMVAAADGSVLPLQQFEDEPGGRASFSPDDRYLAITLPVGGDRSSRDIWLLATDGSGQLFPIVEHPAADRVVGWVPGTQTVLFQSDRSGSPDLWAVEVVDGRSQGSPRALRRNVGDPWYLGFTDDGKMFYAVYTHRFNTFIAPFNAETGEIATEKAQALLGSYTGPAWSPTGEFLALVSQQDVRGSYGESLVVRDHTTGEERKLAPHIDLSYAGLKWSPDGRYILLSGEEWRDPGKNPALYRVDVESGETAPLVDYDRVTPWGPAGASAVWVAGGRKIAYAHMGHLRLRDLESGAERELFRDERLASRLLATTPDGEWLAFGIGGSEHTLGRPDLRDEGRILSMPAEGGEVRELATISNPGQITDIDWTPDGEYVLFWQEREEGGAFLRVPRRGGQLEELWAANQSLGHVGLHPSGSSVAYAIMENDMEIWVMENLLAVLNKGSGG